METKLRQMCADLRRKPIPLADIIPALQEAADELTRLRAEVGELTDVLTRNGFVRCGLAACNCGSWHARYGYPERMAEIEKALADAGHPLSNDNGNLPLRALAALVTERNRLRARVETLRADAERLDWVMPIFDGSDESEGDQRTLLIARFLMLGKSGRDLIDAARGQKCHYCEKTHEPHSLRPYGPRGAMVCFGCATASPERKAETGRNFSQQLDACGPVAVVDGSEVGPYPFDNSKARGQG